MGATVTAETVAGVTSGDVVTASVDPAANELWCVFLAMRRRNITPAISGTGLSWTLIANQNNTQNDFRCFLWRGLSTSDPAAGAITITLPVNTLPAVAVVWKATGVDTGGVNGANAVEALVIAPGPVTDNDDMKAQITTLTDDAVVVAMGSHRGQIFTVPGGETAVSINNLFGTAGDRTTASVWRKPAPVKTTLTIGADNDLNALGDWLAFAVSLKSATSISVAVAPIVQVRTRSYSVPGTLGAPSSISVSVFNPLTLGGGQIAEFSNQLASYEHEIVADGGYWSARIRVDDTQLDMEDWYERGLGRKIVAYSPEGVTVWEGVVNTIKLSLGGLSKTIGPLLDIANKTRLIFSYIDTSSGTPVTGLRLTTAWADNLASQSRYGILEKVLSSGGTTIELADEIRDLYLAENARPARSEELTLGGGGQSMELECVGVVRFLDRFTYNSTTTGAQNLSAKLAAVLAADPNDFILQDFSLIDTNTLQVSAFDNDNRIAWGIIKELVAQGDASNNRWLFGVYANRQAQYRRLVEQTDYLQSLSDPGQRVYVPGGSIVEPWYILPGRWLQVTDFMVGRIPDSTSLRDDPRFMLIESVTFRAPYSVTLKGGKFSRLEQKLARLGLAGIGG